MQMQDRRKNAAANEDEGGRGDGRLVLLTSFILSVFGGVSAANLEGQFGRMCVRRPFVVPQSSLVPCPNNFGDPFSKRPTAATPFASLQPSPHTTSSALKESPFHRRQFLPPAANTFPSRLFIWGHSCPHSSLKGAIRRTSHRDCECHSQPTSSAGFPIHSLTDCLHFNSMSKRARNI